MENVPNPRDELEPLMSIGELASYLGVPVKTVYDWRVTGRGPRGVRVGRHVKFAVADVRAWVDAHRDRDTSSTSGR
jgi:excisionase family DNA binding protein